MDDDLLLPPPDAPIGELVTVKNHPPTPSKNGTAVNIVWEKVLSDELLQVGDDEVRECTSACSYCDMPTCVLTRNELPGPVKL